MDGIKRVLIQPTARPPVARILWADVATASAAAGAAAFAAALYAGFGEAWLLAGTAIVKNVAAGVGFPVAPVAVNQLKSLAAIAAGTIAAAATGWRLAEPVEQEIHNEGRRLIEAQDVAQRQRATEGDPIVWIADIPFSLKRLRRSLFFFGSPGGGKTQLGWQFLPQLQAAGFKLLIVDGPKGDYTEYVKNALVVAPWREGYAWDIGKDVGKSRNRARTLAARLIPASDSDPMWSNAAQMAFVACCCKLIVESGDRWGWGELYDLLSSPILVLKEISENYYPPAARALADAESKTTQSIVINLDAFCADVFEMACSWRNAKKKISFVDWFCDEKHLIKTIILQGSGEFEGLARAYIQGILGLLIAQTVSPSLPENDDRKIIIYIDELAQLGKIVGLEKFMEVGRGKGISAILATQSPQQIIINNSETELNNWTAQIGSKFYLRILGDADQTWVSNQFGSREVWTPTQTVTTGAGATSTSTGYQRTELPGVMHKSRLADLGPVGEGPDDKIRALYDDGRDCSIFEFSKTILGDANKQRPVSLPNPDFDKITPTNRMLSASAPDVAASMAAGEEDGGAEGQRVSMEAPPDGVHQDQMDKIEQIDDTDFLPPTEPDTDTLGDGLGLPGDSNDAGGLVNDLAQEHIIDAVAEHVGIPSEPLSMLFKITDEASDGVGFDQTQTPIVISKKKARRRKSAEPESEATA